LKRQNDSLKPEHLGLSDITEPLEYGGSLTNFDSNIVNIAATGAKAFCCDIQWDLENSKDITEEWIPRSQARIDSKGRIWLSDWIIGKKRQQELEL